MRYLITGGTGSFGKRYAKRLHERGDHVTIFSRDEFKQWEMRRELGTERIDYIVGDVRDYESVYTAIDESRAYCVVHAAALKHVLTGENQPDQVIETNIGGTRNVAKTCKDLGAFMVLLSTDKACQPVNLYGATKMVAEKLTLASGFNVTRYGNVMGSRGSVLHIFNEQKHNGHFTITDRRMTRFAITFDEAMDAVDIAFDQDRGTILVPVLPSFRIVDLARAFDPAATFEEIGIGEGEKLHEELATAYELSRADLITADGMTYHVIPRGGHIVTDQKGLVSARRPWMDVAEIQEVIRESV